MPVYQLTIQGSTHFEWSTHPDASRPRRGVPDMSSGVVPRRLGPADGRALLGRVDGSLAEAARRARATATPTRASSPTPTGASATASTSARRARSPTAAASCTRPRTSAPIASRASSTRPPCAGEPLPPSSCHVTTQPQRAGLRIRDVTPDAKDQLKWTWLAGDVTLLPDFGNPAAGTTSYNLCVYDHRGGNAAC